MYENGEGNLNNFILTSRKAKHSDRCVMEAFFKLTVPICNIDLFVLPIHLRMYIKKIVQHLAVSYMCDSRLPILYRESKPWVVVNNMSPCLYHESLSIPWVHVYTMSPCQYQEFYSIPWVQVCTMKQRSQCGKKYGQRFANGT